MMRRISRRLGYALAALIAPLLAALLGFGNATDAPPPSAAPATSEAAADDDARIAAAFRDRQSDLFVETSATVIKLLPDDNKGSRHQRFIIRLDSGLTILVSHNIDLAPRIDTLRVDDRVSLRGEYEWNARGGVIHWTHHDPKGRHAGGWIRHHDRVYK